MARMSLVHVSHQWPAAIAANLWPNTVHCANSCINAAPSPQDKQKCSPLQLFSGVDADTNKKHWKPFGAPVCALDVDLQADHQIGKWKEWAWVRTHLGHSPFHNMQTALILDKDAGCVSLQFHVSVDSSFHTLKQEQTSCNWRRSTCFALEAEQVNQKQTAPKLKKRKRSPELSQHVGRIRF